HGPTVTGWFEPTTPIWVNRNDQSLLQRPVSPIQVASGSASLEVISHTAIFHEYKIDAATPALIRENTFYFPGWTIYIDGIKAQVQYDLATYSGVIHFSLPQGQHDVKVIFEDTPVRAFADRASLIFLGIFGLTFVLLNIRSLPRVDRGKS